MVACVDASDHITFGACGNCRTTAMRSLFEIPFTEGLIIHQGSMMSRTITDGTNTPRLKSSEFQIFHFCDESFIILRLRNEDLLTNRFRCVALVLTIELAGNN